MWQTMAAGSITRFSAATITLSRLMTIVSSWLTMPSHQGLMTGSSGGWSRNYKKPRAAGTRLVFLHTPLFDPRGDNHHHCLAEEMGRRLAALFQQYRVTHIFAGHIHSYFVGAWQGVPFTITAGAGAPLYGTGPEHYFFHYLKVTLQGDQVLAQVERVAPPASGRLDRLDSRVWLTSIPARPFVGESPGKGGDLRSLWLR